MTSKMSYPKIIQWRIRLLWTMIALMLVIMVVVGETGGRDSRFMSYFTAQGGNALYWWGLIYMIVRLVINKKLLKNRLRLKEKQLREWDERNQYLHRMSGGWVMDAMLLFAYLAAVVTSCYSNEAFYASYGLLAGAALLKAGAYLAYSKGWIKS